MWGGGRPEIGPFLKGEAGAWGGESSKTDLPFAWFFGPERDAPFWTLVGGFRRFSSGFKRRNTVIYGVFVRLAWQKYILQHAENCVNTTVFVRFWP